MRVCHGHDRGLLSVSPDGLDSSESSSSLSAVSREMMDHLCYSQHSFVAKFCGAARRC